MPRPVVCPHCREELDIPLELRDREVRCAVCRNTFIPDDGDLASAPPPPALRAEPARSRSRDEFDDDFSERPRRPKRTGSNRTVWVLILGMLSCCGLGCGGFCIWGIVMVFPNFEPYDSAEGRFHAEFPGEPKKYQETDEQKRTRHKVDYHRQFPEETFFVHYVDLTDKAKLDEKAIAATLKEAADQERNRHPGTTERGRMSSTVGGYDSVDLSLTHAGQPKAMTVVRIVLVERRLYYVGVTGKSNLQFDTPYVMHFMDAFRIEPAAKNEEPAQRP